MLGVFISIVELCDFIGCLEVQPLKKKKKKSKIKKDSVLILSTLYFKSSVHSFT
jgi:hypothetical protein